MVSLNVTLPSLAQRKKVMALVTIENQPVMVVLIDHPILWGILEILEVIGVIVGIEVASNGMIEMVLKRTVEMILEIKRRIAPCIRRILVKFRSLALIN
jgi:hypothetical protein